MHLKSLLNYSVIGQTAQPTLFILCVPWKALQILTQQHTDTQTEFSPPNLLYLIVSYAPVINYLKNSGWACLSFVFPRRNLSALLLNSYRLKHRPPLNVIRTLKIVCIQKIYFTLKNYIYTHTHTHTHTHTTSAAVPIEPTGQFLPFPYLTFHSIPFPSLPLPSIPFPSLHFPSLY
jgi:hypothetical protein